MIFLISCIYVEDGEKIPCIITSISVGVNNKLQVQNSSNKSESLIIRTGNWYRKISFSAVIRDDLELCIDVVDNNDGTKNKKITVKCNESSSFLVELKNRIELSKNFTDNKLKQFLTSLMVFDLDENPDKTIDLTRTVLKNFGKDATYEEVDAKLIDIVVDDMQISTDVSSNISTINVSGSFRFFGKFKESDFLKEVVGDK